jgi:hypothetical protein
MNDVKRPYRNLRSNTGVYVKSAPSVSVINIERESQRNINKGVQRNDRPDISHKLDVFERERVGERVDRSDAYFNRPKQIQKVRVKRRMSLLQRMLILIAIVALFIFLLLTFVFNSATVTITPRIETVNFNSQNANVTLVNTDTEKMYDIVEIKKQASQLIPKSDTKRVLSKAVGTITVYNNYNTETQKLVKNTRFETPDGKVYRLTTSIVVPGKVGTVPGHIDVKVSADSVGEDYNISASKFTIPGFKGSPRYSGFYAESNSPMTGGANGERAIVSQDDIDSANTILKTQIEGEVQKEVTAIHKDSYMVATGTVTYEYTDNINDLLSNKTDSYQLSANVKVILIKTAELAHAIASSDVSAYKNEDVDLYMTDKISISLAKDQKPTLTSPVTILLQGTQNILFVSDVKNIQATLVGKSGEQSNFNNLLAPFSGIDSAVSKIFPYWINTFPKNPNKIEVVQVLPKTVK